MIVAGFHPVLAALAEPGAGRPAPDPEIHPGVAVRLALAGDGGITLGKAAAEAVVVGRHRGP